MEVYAIPIAGEDGGDKYIIYRPLTGLAFVGNRAMTRLACDASPDVAMDPRVLEFLRAVGYFAPEAAAPARTSGEFRPTTAVLLLTNRCQLRCVYCYAAAGDAPRRDLPAERAQAAIEYVCRSAQRLGRARFEVSFHGGGEPTCAWTLLQECVAHARRQPLSAKITLTSNGVWSESQRDWLLANLDGLTLSLDGGPEIQDRQRPLRSGGGSSGWVMETVVELDRRKFPYALRLTAVAPWSNLLSAVEFLCAETQCRAMQVEPAFNTGRGGHAETSDAEGEAFADAFLESADFAARAGRRLHYSGARLEQVTCAFCTAPYEALIVNPDGDLVTCYEVTGRGHPLGSISTIGRIDGGIVTVDETARSGLHALMAGRRAACRPCFCYWSCAGDCYSRTYAPGPGGHLRRGVRCTINRRVLGQLLLQGIEQGRGIWRRPARRAAPHTVEPDDAGE